MKLLLVAGARPNFMKIAPLIRAIEASSVPEEGSIEWLLVHTGQHYDDEMCDIFFSDLGIPAPHFNLEVGSSSHASQTAEIMKRFEPVCLEEKPDWVVVVGDVNSTLACALVAAKLAIRVAHVEAGLRSYDRTMPEEINRVVTDSVSDLLFTPNQDANENLRREGISESKIRLVGNIMIDSLIAHLNNRNGSNGILQQLNLNKRSFLYVTLHRPSNVDSREALGQILGELSAISDRMPVVFPLHPRTRKRVEEFGLSFPQGQGMKLLDPVGYNDSLTLAEHARCVLTDSGGLQEETTFFGTPCLTLRPNTERPVTITLGSNRLTSAASLRSDFQELLQRPERLGTAPPLWDGKASERILQSLLEF